jgi:hypothetical protein
MTFRSWNDFKIWDLEFVKPQLNREQKVQECDARMMKRITEARNIKRIKIKHKKTKNQ